MKIRYIVICIIAGITLSLVTACNRRKVEILGGDDQPILVVGGSLHVMATEGKWQGSRGNNWKHTDEHDTPSARHVTKIEIVHMQKNFFGVYKRAFDEKEFYKKVSIVMDYGSTQQSIVLETDSNGNGLTLTSGSTANQSLPNVVSFTTGTLQQVVLKEAGQDDLPYPCGSNGRCTLLIHYCDIAGGCK